MRPVDDAVRVLCVDDDREVARLVADTLAAADDRVEATVETDPEAALAAVDEGVDCVVSDYRMPGLDGVALLERVRESFPDLPFVLFTGEGSERVAADAVAAGVTEYVPKGAGGGSAARLVADRALDAVERRRAEARLERTRETQRALIEAAPVPMWIQDVEEIRFANEAAAEFFGEAAPADLVGQSALEYVEPEDREAVRERNRDMMVNDGSADALEGYTIGADGAKRYGIYAGAAVRFEGRDALLVVARDITDRKRREEALRERNERLSAFASVVSHDVRTPLATASGHVDAALRALGGRADDRVAAGAGGAGDPSDASDPEPGVAGADADGAGADAGSGDEPDADVTATDVAAARDHLATVADAHARMDEITDDLLELARKGRAVDDPTPTFLSELAADVRATVDGVSVEVESDGRLSVDPGRMRDLLSNLVANARDHGDASTVRVGTLRSGATGRATAGASDPAGGDGDGAGDATDGASGRARGFYVEDDGCGVPPDRRERVFESGYSTAETGTGFGLAIVERVAEAHGWTVDLTDGPDGGARFEFRPRAV